MKHTEQPASPSERRPFLSVLDAAVREHGGMSCGVIIRRGLPVLHVINAVSATRSVEVGCDFTEGAWRFVWAGSGEVIGAVDDVASVVRVIAREVGTHLEPSP
ncbi:hypothetical protein [Actinomadura macrotermitis]|uniref:Uncharacterized protein n=1 Tax=Actinomadura macrotermitis TaxID=2585200 RepID=A0A7K0BSQ3_9ACTN|nr:hypothetical protein [Actinomadura macrotermitis]MQY04223.1 hypothetical protein [Actinomadura macrotermitis]